MALSKTFKHQRPQTSGALDFKKISWPKIFLQQVGFSLAGGGGGGKERACVNKAK